MFIFSTNIGFATSLDAQVKPSPNTLLIGLGSYSTANQSYWSHFNAAYVFDESVLGGLAFGPTASFSGSTEYYTHRFGLSFSNIDLKFARCYINSGYSRNENDTSSIYFGLGLERNLY